MIEYQLPKDGHDGVFTDRAVIGAIIGGPNSAVAQAFADAGQVTNVTGRVLINNAATAHAQNLRDEAWFAWRHTAIDDGITLAKQDLHGNGLHTSRRGIDAAGDGTNNASRAAQDARDATVGPGHHASPSPPRALSLGCRRTPVRPAGSPTTTGARDTHFVMEVQPDRRFAQALRQTLMEEIASGAIPHARASCVNGIVPLSFIALQ